MIRNGCIVLVLLATTCTADDGVDIPLQKIVLFNSGLGYFEHQKEIDGTADVDPSLAPVSEQLRSFSIDLTTQPTLGELLHQLRGEEIELDDGKITGTIVGVELKPQGVGQQVVNREVLNLLTDKGLRGVVLDSVDGIQLVNEKLNAELRDALKLLVSGRRADKKTVRFHFTGDGKRTVRIGYIRETPIWKTSYRVVLDNARPSLLQGWAILENTSEVDWEDVALTLTSATANVVTQRTSVAGIPRLQPGTRSVGYGSTPPTDHSSRRFGTTLCHLDGSDCRPRRRNGWWNGHGWHGWHGWRNGRWLWCRRRIWG
jgi:hypothetical protein